MALWTPTCQDGVNSDRSPTTHRNHKEEGEWDWLQWNESEEEHNKDMDDEDDEEQVELKMDTLWHPPLASPKGMGHAPTMACLR